MRYLLYLLLLLVSEYTFSQATDSTKQNIKIESDLRIPESKPAINIILEELKPKIVEIESQIKALKQYGQALGDYRGTINSFIPGNVMNAMKTIESDIRSGKTESIYDEEESLINTINPLGFNYRFRQNSDFLIGADFSRRVTGILNDMLSGLTKISNEHNGFSDRHKPTVTSLPELEKLKQILSAEQLDKMLTSLKTATKDEISINENNISLAEKDLKSKLEYKEKLIEKLGEQDTQINGLAIKLGLPLFCATILLLFLGPAIIKLFTRPGNYVPESQSQNVLVEISTVLLLTMSILILGLSGKVNGDVLGTLIGGISGYVL